MGWFVGELGSGGEVLYVIRWWGAVSMTGGCAADPLHRLPTLFPPLCLGMLLFEAHPIFSLQYSCYLTIVEEGSS